MITDNYLVFGWLAIACYWGSAASGRGRSIEFAVGPP